MNDQEAPVAAATRVDTDTSETGMPLAHETRGWPWWLALLLTVIVAGAIVGLCTYRYHGFFIIDDAQNNGIGFYREMGRLWMAGHLPILSTRTLWGGNILVDMVMSPFAPQTIIASIVSGQTQSITAVANTVAFLDLTLVIGGGYWLGRVMRIRSSLSLLLGALIATTPVFLYVFMESWWNMAHAFAWLVPSLAALLHLRRNWNAASFAAAVLCGACLFASAGTQMQLFYGLMFPPILIIDWKDRGSLPRQIVLCSVGACVLLISAIPLMSEYIVDRSLISRISDFNNIGAFLTPSWGHVVNFFNPFYNTYMAWYGGYSFIPLPLAYAGIVVLLPFLFKKFPSKSTARYDEYQILAVGLVIALVMSFSSQQLGPLRYPFRFLPMFVICIAIIGFYMIEHCEWRRTTARLVPVLATFSAVACTVQLFSADREVLTPRHILFVSASYLLLTSFVIVIPENPEQTARARAWLVPWAWIVSILAVIGMLAKTPTMCGVHWSCPGLNDAVVGKSMPIQPGYTLALSGRKPRANVWDLDSGQLLALGQPSINGYSPVGHIGFRHFLPSKTAHGYFLVPETLKEMTARVPSLDNVPVYQLFGVRRIYAWKKDITPDIQRRLNDAGLTSITPLPNDRVAIEPADAPDLEGTLTFQSQPGGVRHVGNNGPRSEWFDVQSSDTPRQLVFNRIVWFGYHAELNGKPLPVENWENTLIRVELPPGAAGTLHVHYDPVSWKYSRFSIAIGLLLACAVMLYLRFYLRRAGSSLRACRPRC